MKKIEFFLLLSILAGAFLVRLYGFNNPIADWHSWRQADTSSVSRNFIKHGFDILHPKFDDLSKGVSLIDNPSGYRFVEFPIYNLIQAILYKTFNYFSLEQWGRLVTIFSQLASIVFIYLIVRKYGNNVVALISCTFFAFIPYNIYYGRTLLPDSSMVMAMLGGIYFFDKWLEEKSSLIFFALSVLFTASAFLFKPFALFFTLPIIYLAIRSYGLFFFRKWQLFVFAIFTILPLIAWRLWMSQYPEGIPQSNWLFNQYGIRFKGAFFHWLFAERIGSLILGYFGLIFVTLGILLKGKKEGFLWYCFLVSSLLYMFVIAYGNVHHDYYQILIMPTLAIFFAKGVYFILKNSGSFFSRYISYGTVFICIVFMLAFSWFRIRDYYNLQNIEVLAAGKAVNDLTPKNAKVIAPYGGDTTLLYHTKRRGWPVWDRDLHEFLKQGASYLVFVNPTTEDLNWKKYFMVLDEREKEYIIFDLGKPLPAAKNIINKVSKE